MKNVSYPVLRSTTLKPADLIRAANELQLEGVIAKRKSSIYQPGKRTSAWLKYKINQEFVVGGYTLGGNPFDARIVDCYDDGKLRYVGKVRAGFAHSLRNVPVIAAAHDGRMAVADLPEKRRTLYSLTRDEMKNCQWLKPLLVAQIEFQELDAGWSPAAREFC